MTPADRHFFEFPHFDLTTWSYSDLLRVLPPDLANLSRRGHRTVILEAEINHARLETASATQIARLEVDFTDKGLRLGCDCGEATTRICGFQVQAVLNLVENNDLRLFFDPARRQELLRGESLRYGLEEDPENHLELIFHQGRPVVKPVNEHLQPVDDDLLNSLAGRLIPKPPVPEEWDAGTIRILVWTQSRFKESYLLNIYEAIQGTKGSLRGPLRQLHAVDLMLEAESSEQLKFYGAVAKFSNRTKSQIADRQFFHWLLKNPDKLPVYIHNFDISESVTAAALRPVEMVTREMELTLQVHQAGDFYEITGTLTIAGKYFDLLETRLRYGDFLLAGDRLHLIEHEGFRELLVYLQQTRNKIVLHKNKFEAFRTTILEKVEKNVRVIYTYLKHASKKQRDRLLPEGSLEKIIYLDDAGQFVHITPVLRYGKVEMPVFSPRVLYMTDPDGKPFLVERDTQTEIELATVVMLSYPAFAEQTGTDFVYLHKSRFLDENWFLKTFEEWRRQGITVLGFEKIRGNRWNPHAASVTVSVVSGVDWFETKVKVHFGKEVVPLRQLFTSVRNKTRYIQLSDGTVGILPEEWLQKLTGYFRIGTIEGNTLRTPKHHFHEMKSLYPDAYLSPEIRRDLEELSAKLDRLDGLPDIPVPRGLKTSLRDYQHTGLKWLNMLSDLGFGACLADDMGLGKTLQVIALLLHKKEMNALGTSLVVMPTSLLFNWQAEIARHAPALKFGLYYGEGRRMDFDVQQQYDVILTTYTVMTAEIHRLRSYVYDYLILDESHNIKNPSSQRYRAACQLKARHRILMTGTPVENNTWDLYGQFSFACPGLLGSRRYFKDQFFMPVDKFRDDRRRQELQARIRPFLLRRTKEMVAKELPPKTEMVLYCEMPDEQRRVYDASAQEFRNYLNGKSDGDIAREKLHVLQGLTKLRQLCISPSIVNDEEFFSSESAKITVLMEQLEELVPHHKVLVFSQFVTVLNLVRQELEQKGIGYAWLTGDTKERGKVVNGFETDPARRVFLVSLKAGGTGLNLTSADYVFLLDPWWNPAIENQAIDRTHRIGQQKNVVAVRLICPGTIEEKILELQENKRELSNELINSEEAALGILHKDAILRLVSPMEG